MLAVESERVCKRSPENIAAVFGAVAPFTHADPLVYNIADADSPAIICAGNAAASKQQNADRVADLSLSMDDMDIVWIEAILPA